MFGTISAVCCVASDAMGVANIGLVGGKAMKYKYCGVRKGDAADAWKSAAPQGVTRVLAWHKNAPSKAHRACGEYRFGDVSADDREAFARRAITIEVQRQIRGDAGWLPKSKGSRCERLVDTIGSSFAEELAQAPEELRRKLFAELLRARKQAQAKAEARKLAEDAVAVAEAAQAKTKETN